MCTVFRGFPIVLLLDQGQEFTTQGRSGFVPLLAKSIMTKADQVCEWFGLNYNAPMTFLIALFTVHYITDSDGSLKRQI